VRALVLLNGLSHMLVPGQRIIAVAMGRAMMPHVVAHAASPAPSAAPPPAPLMAAAVQSAAATQ
jgi:hypothetical protein